MALTIPNSFTAYTKIQSSQVNANFTAISTYINNAFNSDVLKTTYGGTGLSSYTTGDTLYASATNVLSKLPVGTNGQFMQLASGIPSWASVLGAANGGTGQSSYTAGDFLVASGTTTLSKQAIGSDGQVLVVDTTQSNKLKWTTLQQGAKNYITYGSFENNATTGWSLGSASIDSTTKFPTGSPTFNIGTSSGTLSIATSSSSPLAGTYSLTYVDSAATTAGKFLHTDAYTIDSEDKAKPLAVSFSYEISSGASNGVFGGTSSDSFGIAIYYTATSGNGWLMPAGVRSMYQSSGAGKAYATFQTPSDTTSLRVVFFNANATSGAITVKLDSFVLGPEKTVQGVPASDWAAYTPTVTGIGTGSESNKAFYWLRVGNDLHIKGTIRISSGTGSSNVAFTVPSGVSINTSILRSGGLGYNLLGQANITSLTNTRYIDALSSTTFGLFNFGSSNVIGSDLSGSNIDIIINATLPVVGWSSNVAMSSDSDTRVVSLSSTRSAAQSITHNSETTIIFNNPSKDTHSILNTSTGIITVPVSGRYTFNGVIVYAANGSGIRYIGYKVDSGSTLIVSNINGNGVYGNYIPYTFSADLNAGQTVQIRTYQDSGSSVNVNAESYFHVTRASGPAVIAASETVYAKYNNVAGTSITNLDSTIPFATKISDSHGFFNGSVATIPVSGTYLICAKLHTAAVNNSTSQALILNFKITSSGVESAESGLSLTIANKYGNGVSLDHVVHGCKTYRLLAGDTFQVLANNSNTVSLNTTAGSNWVSITRVGNY
jgi:hypothetical protein